MAQFCPDLNILLCFICLAGPTESENVTEEPFRVWECNIEHIIFIFKSSKFLQQLKAGKPYLNYFTVGHHITKIIVSLALFSWTCLVPTVLSQTTVTSTFFLQPLPATDSELNDSLVSGRKQNDFLIKKFFILFHEIIIVSFPVKSVPCPPCPLLNS